MIRFLLSLTVASSACAGLVVDPGLVKAPVGATSVSVPVRVTGGDRLTDMAGLVEAGSPPSFGLTITGVSFEGSLWSTAAGGYTSFMAPLPPAATVGPNVSLNVAGQSVVGSGLLMTLTVNMAGKGVGDYPVRLANTQGGDTVFANGAAVVNATFLSGVIRLVDGYEGWQLTAFATEITNPALESTIWGDLADPDHDGLTNLMEYYLGTDPRVATTQQASPTTAGRPACVFVSSGGQTYSAIGYTRRKLPGSISAVTESSVTLTSWPGNNLLDVQTPVALPGGTLEYVVRRLGTPIPAGDAREFIRLKVTRP